MSLLNRHGAAANKEKPGSDSNRPTVYQIRLEGQLDARWADWFEGMSITLDRRGDTILTGPVVDQAALHGLLKKVRDLGMPLVSVNRIEGEEGGKGGGT